MKRLMSSVILGVTVVALSGCFPDLNQQIQPGPYDGFLITHSPQINQEDFITGSLQVVSKDELLISLRGNKTADFTIGVRASKSDLDRIDLYYSGYGHSISMKWDDSKKCFKAGGSQLCLEKREARLHLIEEGQAEITVVVDPHRDDYAGAREEPAAYTVEQLIELAKAQSFTSQIQFATAQKSKADMMTAHLSLLPSFKFNQLFGLMSMQMTTYIQMIGDLAPFLMPSKWLAADEASAQYKSDFDGWLIAKADAGNIAEGLAYGVLRDEKTLSTLASYEQPITSLRDEILDREKLGIMPVGSSADLSTVLNSLIQMQSSLAEVIREEKMSLAQAVGKMNPQSVSGVIPPGEYPSLDQPLPETPETLHSLVVQRSLELRQTDLLMAEANDKAVGRLFYWIDPTGEGVGLGPAFPTSIMAGMAQVKVIAAQRNQQESILNLKLDTTLAQIQQAVKDYKLAGSSLDLQRFRIKQLLDQKKLGIIISVTDLQNALQNALQYETSRINTEFAYYLTWGRLNRLLYSGPYNDIEPQRK